MMLSGFFAPSPSSACSTHLNYWVGFAGAVAAMALFRMLAERVVVQPILGYPQFSIIMATIGLDSSPLVVAIWYRRFKIGTPR